MKQAIIKTLRSFKQILPILVGVLLLISLITTVIPKHFYNKIFIGNKVIDSFIGAIFGSISAGNAINSYIIGGEMLQQGVNMTAITAFIISWVTVGIVQLPAESLMLGKKFAFTRNIVSFITAIIIAILTVFTIRLI
ncbi:permease [Candidatus Aerophobetes bacterium]|nr:permease [Candidatus Aerophobetes bacterium]